MPRTMSDLVTTAKKIQSSENWSHWGPDIENTSGKITGCRFLQVSTRHNSKELGKAVFCMREKKAMVVNRTVRENIEPHPKNDICKQSSKTLLCTMAVGSQTQVT